MYRQSIVVQAMLADDPAISATISDFAFPFCDTQLDGFSGHFRYLLTGKRVVYFVIHRFCEIGFAVEIPWGA